MTENNNSVIAAIVSSSQRWFYFGTQFGAKFGAPNTPIPTLLMQTIVEKGDKTDEGELIIAVTLPFCKIIEELLKDQKVAYQMTPRMWEEMVAGIHEQSGLFDEVILTPRSGDHGRDVIAIKKIGRASCRERV